MSKLSTFFILLLLQPFAFAAIARETIRSGRSISPIIYPAGKQADETASVVRFIVSEGGLMSEYLIEDEGRSEELWASGSQRELVEGVDYELSEDKKTLTRWRATDLTELDMTLDSKLAQVEHLADFAFAVSNNALLRIELPSTLQSIGRQTFRGSKLQAVNLPKRLKKIGYWDGQHSNPFTECKSLTAITVETGNRYFKAEDGVLYSSDGTQLIAFPAKKDVTDYQVKEGVESIQPYAFSEALSVKKIIFPASVKQIRKYAFIDATLLESVTLSEGIQQIGWAAFIGTGITKIVLPSSLEPTKEGREYANPFFGTLKLKTISISGQNKHFTLRDGILYVGEQEVLICLPPAFPITDYTLPASTKQIAMGAFGMHQTLKTVRIRQHVAVPSRAFEGCIHLNRVNLVTGTSSIGARAFNECYELSVLSLMGRTLPNLSNNIPFEAVPKAFAVEVPIGMKSIYMADPRWKEVEAQYLEATPVYEYVSLHREEVFSLAKSVSIHLSNAETLVLSGDRLSCTANIVGSSSMIFTPQGGSEKLYLFEVKARHNQIVEPYLREEDRSRATIEQYEKEVAKRVPVSEEDMIGGKLVAYANPEQEGLNVKYLYIDGVAAMYTTMVFDSKAVFDKLQGNTFFEERYTPAKGVDMEGETFDGFVRDGAVGYERKELALEEGMEPVVTLQFFFVKQLSYEPVTLSLRPSIATTTKTLEIRGNEVYLPESAVELSIYDLSGRQLYQVNVRGRERFSLPELIEGNYLLLCRTSSTEILAAKLRL